jgi:hypothetical protein
MMTVLARHTRLSPSFVGAIGRVAWTSVRTKLPDVEQHPG